NITDRLPTHTFVAVSDRVPTDENYRPRITDRPFPSQIRWKLPLVTDFRQNSLSLKVHFLVVQFSHVYLHKNNFSGQFPSSLTHWTMLEFLDLSDNNFSGRLPDNVVSSSTLVNFTVSNNNLSGPIPSSLARFPGTAFSGNFELCGKPLSNTCNKTKYPESSSPSDSLSSDNKKKKKRLDPCWA
ncbi:probable inactive receptor kinase, partial [Tanacetum coccineum]